MCSTTNESVQYRCALPHIYYYRIGFHSINKESYGNLVNVSTALYLSFTYTNAHSMDDVANRYMSIYVYVLVWCLFSVQNTHIYGCVRCWCICIYGICTTHAQTLVMAVQSLVPLGRTLISIGVCLVSHIGSRCSVRLKNWGFAVSLATAEW